MAVTTVPRTTARVTEESRVSKLLAPIRRRAERASRRGVRSARPSRMMKNRMNSITVNESTVPTAPRNAMPP